MSSWRGVTRVQAWPRARGYPSRKPEQNRLEIFRLVQRLIKWLGPKETLYAREAIEAHNKAHTGQRGSAAIRFRDWQTQRLFGRGIAVFTEEGITFYPSAVSRDASFILDHCTGDHGQILQRASAEWQDIPVGAEGAVLTSQGSAKQNAWETPA